MEQLAVDLVSGNCLHGGHACLQAQLLRTARKRKEQKAASFFALHVLYLYGLAFLKSNFAFYGGIVIVALTEGCIDNPQ